MSDFEAVYGGLERHAPGDDRVTLEVLAELGADPRVIADLGCGTGASALPLARATGAVVVAIDAWRSSLDTLRRRIGSERIAPVQADMARPPLRDGSVDLVWSEGAAYAIGFDLALARWRDVVRPGGFVVVSELTWLVDDPPPAARAFWDAAYPAARDRSGNRRAFEAAGWELLGERVLPRAAWEAYYGPLEARIAGRSDPVSVDTRAEIDLYRAHGESYGYVFYWARRPA